VLTQFIHMSGLAFGAALYGFLLVLLIRKRPARPIEWALLWAIAGTVVWYLSGAVADLYQVVGNPADEFASPAFQYGRWFGLCLISSAALHIAAVRSGRFAPLAYLFLPVGWLVLHSQMELTFRFLVAGSLAGAMVELLLPPTDIMGKAEHRLRRAMSVALVLPVAGAVAGTDSPWFVLGAFAPGLGLLYFIARYNALGLYINRNIKVATVLGVSASICLLLVQSLGELAEDWFDAWGQAIKVMLILAVAAICIPLYAWMNRVLTKRSQVFAEFGRRLVHEAAAIFGLEQRMDYIARELARILKLRRVLLVATSTPEPRIGVAGTGTSPYPAFPIAEIAEQIRTRHVDTFIGPRSAPDVLSGIDFNYLLPLWYEDRLSGLLFLDTSPRLLLNEDESILAGLSGQISQAIESCILVERKIDLEKSLERTEHMATRGQMAARIAHEVRNPLASIKALAQLMQEDPDLKDDYRRDLSWIVGEVNRLNSCVEELLTPPPAEMRRHDVAVPELFERICHAQNHEHGERNVRIEWRAPVGLTLRNVDLQSLTQVVLNLVKNAAQACYPGGAVELSAAQNGEGRLAITVTDHGTGIAPEVLPRVFQERVTTKENGNGLGLAIVKRNLENMGGDIGLESPVDGMRGTRATVTLPLEVA
jgi:signal transduction histidine kinase